VPTADGKRVRNTLPAISRWKIADNLRRSLLPIALVALLLAGWIALPGGPSLWTGVVFLVLFFPAYVQWGQTFTNRARGVRFRDHLNAERVNLTASLHQVLLHSAFLAHQSFVLVDAILRTVSRLFHRRHLLEWETAADAAAKLQVARHQVFRQMWTAPAIAVLLGVVVVLVEPSSLLWALPVLALWFVSPVFAYRTGLPHVQGSGTLEARDRRELRTTARLTWRFFEETLRSEDNWLVPDNYQENRPDPIAHRTSPTNIGLQMMATVAA
jgi:hypothetical protein